MYMAFIILFVEVDHVVALPLHMTFALSLATYKIGALAWVMAFAATQVA
jgi:hypothetical protein